MAAWPEKLYELIANQKLLNLVLAEQAKSSVGWFALTNLRKHIATCNSSRLTGLDVKVLTSCFFTWQL